MTAVTSDSMSVKNSAYPQLKGFHHIEIYVGNAGQAAHFYRTLFGFEPVAYAGLETGERDHVSYVMKQGDIRLVLTAALSADSPVAEHVRLHGDSVKDIAFQVDDAALAFETAVKRGAEPLMEPEVFESETGRMTTSKISSFGHTVHSFIERDGGEDTFSPNYRPVAKYLPAPSLGFTKIDHIAISVEEGKLDQWIDFYKGTLGFHQSHEEDVYTEHSAMNSKVVEDSSGVIKFPMMEPAPSKRKSQIGEFLDFHRGAGA
ncbi:MAG TPA: VOC family protein, partial [Blastocatellia bacterium]|nr:VOC family protein [Blastocatellia bacterium]